MNNEDIKLRIKELINNNGGVTSFAKKIGTHQSSLSKCLSPDNNVGIAMIDKIVIAFGINKVWLLTGDGEMLKSDNNSTVLKDVSNSRPHIDSSYAECGKPGGFSLCVKREECDMISLPFLKDYDFSVTASGQSMINRTDTSKSIRSGDIVACKLVKSRTHVRFGEVYALSTIDGFTIKKVVESKKEDCIRCESFNVEDGFTPFDIPTNEIFDWAFVIGTVSINKW